MSVLCCILPHLGISAIEKMLKWRQNRLILFVYFLRELNRPGQLKGVSNMFLIYL
jgi:hypothetical protein